MRTDFLKAKMMAPQQAAPVRTRQPAHEQNRRRRNRTHRRHEGCGQVQLVSRAAV